MTLSEHEVTALEVLRELTRNGMPVTGRIWRQRVQDFHGPSVKFWIDGLAERGLIELLRDGKSPLPAWTWVVSAAGVLAIKANAGNPNLTNNTSYRPATGQARARWRA